MGLEARAQGVELQRLFGPEHGVRGDAHASRVIALLPEVVWVGWPVYQAIIGNKLFPGLADRYLAANGWEAQQTESEVSPDREDNLEVPRDDERDAGARGIFGDRSRDSSLFLALTTHRRWVALGAALGAAAAVGVARRLAR